LITPGFSIEKSALTKGKGYLMKLRRDFIRVAEVLPNFVNFSALPSAMFRGGGQGAFYKS